MQGWSNKFTSLKVINHLVNGMILQVTGDSIILTFLYIWDHWIIGFLRGGEVVIPLIFPNVS